MEEVLHTTELLGDSVVRAGPRSAVPSAQGTRRYSESALLVNAVMSDALDSNGITKDMTGLPNALVPNCSSEQSV